MDGEYQRQLKARARGSLALVTSTKSDSPLERQRLDWARTKGSISQLLELCDAPNVKETSIAIFQSVNLFHFKGVLVRRLMKMQRQRRHLTAVYASLVAVLNSKLPEIGELLVDRLILQFRRAFRNNNKPQCVATTQFLGHLVNQRVCSEVLVLQILQLLFDKSPSGATISIGVALVQVVGAHLERNSHAALDVIMQRLSVLVQEQVMDRNGVRETSNLLAIRRSGFKRMPPHLDLVEDEDQPEEGPYVATLDETVKAHAELNTFQFAEDYSEAEAEYSAFKEDVLGGQHTQDAEEKAKEEVEAKEEAVSPVGAEHAVVDMTNSELLAFQKTVYLTIMSSMSSDEAVHKLMKLKAKNYDTLVDMIVKCCSQEKTYSKYYGVIGERLCYQNDHWQEAFVHTFKSYYTNSHQYETNALRNIAKFWGHLFALDRLSIDRSWNEIRLNEDDTNVASRIFLKFMFQEMVEELGIKQLEAIVTEPYIKPHIRGIFPVVDVDWRDAHDMRFSINFFTAIGLGSLTEDTRRVLASLAPPSKEELERKRGRSRSRSSSYSRSLSYSRSSAYLRSPSGSRQGSRSPRSGSSRGVRDGSTERDSEPKRPKLR